MNVFLGVDSGGTNLRACLMTDTGEIISSTKGKSANAISVGKEIAYQNLTAVVAECIKKSPLTNSRITGACFALAGISTRNMAEQARHRILEDSKLAELTHEDIIVTNDTFAALWGGAKHLPAIVLVSGTGSHCLGIDHSGGGVRSSGLEYVLSDEGSAYYLGDKVLRAVTQALDGRGEPTCLKELIFADIGIGTLSEFYEYIYTQTCSTKQIVASFGKFATYAAENGDELAIRIVKDAINSLVIAVQAVVNGLDISDQHFELISIGGVFGSSLFCELFKESMTGKYYGVSLYFMQPNAALGAAKIARDRPDYDIWACYE